MEILLSSPTPRCQLAFLLLILCHVLGAAEEQLHPPVVDQSAVLDFPDVRSAVSGEARIGQGGSSANSLESSHPPRSHACWSKQAVAIAALARASSYLPAIKASQMPTKPSRSDRARVAADPRTMLQPPPRRNLRYLGAWESLASHLPILLQMGFERSVDELWLSDEKLLKS